MRLDKEEIIIRIFIVFVIALMIAFIGAGVYGAIQNEKNAIPAGTIVEKYHQQQLKSIINLKELKVQQTQKLDRLQLGIIPQFIGFS